MIGAQLPDEEILGKAYDARLMARILRYLRPYWKLLAVAFVFLLLQTGTQLLGPYITKIAIDRYMLAKDVHGLDLMALAYLGVVLCGFVVLFVQTYTTEYTGQRAMHDLRMEIFTHLQKQDMAYFDRNAVGRLMTRTINDVETLNELFSTGVVGLMGDVSMVFGIAVVMLWLNWQLALVCLAAFPLILYFSRFYRRRAREVYRREPAYSRPAQCRLAGKHRRRGDGAGLRPGGEDVPPLSRSQPQLPRCLAAQHPLQRRVFSGHRTVQRDLDRPPALVRRRADGLGHAVRGRRAGGVYSVYSTHVPADPRSGREIQHHASRHGIVGADLSACSITPETIKNPPQPKRVENFSGEVEFKNVWLSYQPGDPVLKGISFHVRPGEKVALVGATGGGKTSIISALCRFYDVERGAILVDGIDVREWNKQELRRHLGLVLQDVFLFSGDIATNVTLGDPRISQERMAEAAARAHIAPFVDKLPHGFQEEVQERGSTISQGQRQFLSFAAPWRSIRRYSFSTKRPARWTPKPKR